MASVTSLGLHEPTALHYAIQEQLLPPDAPRSDYSWDITVNHEGGDAGEDELLVTHDAVIWSRGNIFRKCFGFKLEKEPVTQALLTYFPTSGVSSKHGSRPGPARRVSADGRPLSKALMVFLKTQAHIYFLDGTSHVVHMPFEVESASAAPQGVVIQRKQRHEVGLAASIKFPKVPPNSFISLQASPASVRTSLQTTFSTETLGRPKALPPRLSTSTLEGVWGLPTENNDSSWPRLVTMIDPLLELGLVVTQPDRSKAQTRRNSDKSPTFLEKAEEILHIESVPLSTAGQQQSSPETLVLAVTINRESCMYTVWKFTYIRNEDPFRAPKSVKKKTDRRRSSMQPGHPSGVTSPVQALVKESFGKSLPGKRSRKSERQDRTERAIEKFESSLGLEKESAAGRRSSRRVSSMLARADLSASQDRAAFGEQAQIPNAAAGCRRDTSHGSVRTRNSGAFPSVSFTGTVNPNPNTMGSFLEAPVDDLLEELRAGGDFEGFHNMGLDEHDFDGLSQEVLLTKLHSVPVDNSNVRYSLTNQPAKTQCKVFCLSGPPHSADDREHRQILIGIQDILERRLQLLTFHLQVRKRPSPKPKLAEIRFTQLRKAADIVDSCRIVDGDVSTILALSQTPNGQRTLSLEAPWSSLVTLELPPKLSLANIRSLVDRGGLEGREVGMRRAVPPTGQISGLRHSKLHGVVDVVDQESGQLHQLRIQLQPTRPLVATVLEILRTCMDPAAGGRLLSDWWQIVGWLRREAVTVADLEWSALVIQLFSIYLALGLHSCPPPSAFEPPPTKHRRTRSHLRASSSAQPDLGDWDAMNKFETANSATHPAWMEHTPWQWILEQDDAAATMFRPSQGRERHLDFLTLHLKHALAFLTSRGMAPGQAPGLMNNGDLSIMQQAQDTFVALHLLLEEQKLNITVPDNVSPGPTDLRAVMLQIARWLQWDEWVLLYELEMPVDFAASPGAPSEISISAAPPQPPAWNIFDWIQGNLTQDPALQRNLPQLVAKLSRHVMSRTRMFEQLFDSLRIGVTPASFVESMHSSGISLSVLESLPEAVLVPLRDAITQCQAYPPAGWSEELLELVDRSDVSAVLSHVIPSPLPSSNLMVSFLLSRAKR